MKRSFRILALVALLATLASGLVFSQGSSEPEKADIVVNPDGLAPFGENLVYDPDAPVNDNKPITIKFWNASDWDHFFEKWTAEYSKIHPNVTFEFTSNSFADIYKKLPMALQSGVGPDIFFMHNQHSAVLVPNMVPYPKKMVDELREDYLQVDAHLIDNEVYYIDLGIMTSGIFYNKKHWAEAGLTEADIPETWDELIEVGKKLTVLDEDGEIVRAGFNMNTYQLYLWQDLQYQSGEFLFDATGKKALINTPTGKKNLQFLYDLYNKHNIGTASQPANFEAFANQQTSMMYCWGWVSNYLKYNFEDVEFGFFQHPTFDGTTPPALARNNGESSPGVSRHATPEAQAVAFDFIRYMLANDELMLEFDIHDGMAPSKISLSEKVMDVDDPVLQVETEMLPRTVWPGPAPDAYMGGVQTYIAEPLFVAHENIDKVLQEAEDIINTDMETTGFVSVEHLYTYADEF